MTEKIKHRIEYEQDGPLKMLRPHRQFFGPPGKNEPLLIEIEYEENEDLFAAIGVTDDEGCPGRSVRVEQVPGLVITPDPHLFGSDADRTMAGKLPFVKLSFGQWNFLNVSEL